MLKIKDQQGKVVGTLKDEDSEPDMKCEEECKCKKELDHNCECAEEGEEEDAEVQ